MGYLSKADQAKKSAEWYEANKALVLERKQSRQFGSYCAQGSLKHRRAYFELQALSAKQFLTPEEANTAASKICERLGFIDAGRAAFSIISRLGCAEVGLLFGHATFTKGTQQYDEMRDFLNKRKRPQRELVELFILKLTVKANTWTQHKS